MDQWEVILRLSLGIIGGVVPGGAFAGPLVGHALDALRLVQAKSGMSDKQLEEKTESMGLTLELATAKWLLEHPPETEGDALVSAVTEETSDN